MKNLHFGWKEAFYGLVLVGLFSMGILAVLVLGMYSRVKKQQRASVAMANQNQVPAGPVDQSTKPINIILIGHGGAGHPGGALADSLTLVSINPGGKRVVAVSIPRDAWVPLPYRSDKTIDHKINEAYAIGASDSLYPLKQPIYKGENGAGNLTKASVGNMVGIDVDYYISVDFGGFEAVIDKLGGVDVEVPVSFSDNFYPVKGKENETCGKTAKEIDELHQKYSGFELESQFECRYETLHFDKGVNHMDGATALKFVRSRHSSEHGGDFARGQRAQAVLIGIKDKLLASPKNIPELFKELVGSVKTDLNLETVENLARVAGNPKEYSYSHLGLSEDNAFDPSHNSGGQFILVPKAGIDNFSQIQQLVDQAIN